MTVQSVGSFTAGTRTVMNQAGNTAATDSFGKMMSNKINSSSDTKQTASKQSDKNQIENNRDGSVAAGKVSSTEKADSKPESKAIKNEKEIPNGENLKEEASEKAKADADALENLMGQLATLLNAVTEVITEKLEITEEQLTETAISLDIEPGDMLDFNTVKEIFLEANEAQPEALLTDENLLNQMNGLEKSFNEIMDKAEVIEQLPESFEAFENVEQLLENPEFKEVFNEYLLAEEVVAEGAESTEKPLEIEINDYRNEQSTAIRNDAEKEDVETLKSDFKPVDEKAGEETSEKSLPENEEKFVQANNFIKHLAEKAENTEVNEMPTQNSFRELYDITGQTIQHIKVNLGPDTSSMELQLNPAHLGKVDVQISSKAGAVTAEITAHTEAAKRALEAGLEDLKAALSDTGLKVENVEVTLADYGFRHQSDDSNGSDRNNRQNKKRSFVTMDANENLQADFEAVSEIMKEINGNNVDYIA